MNKKITKVSVFLRKVGDSFAVISIPKEGAGFDAANFSKLDQGNPNAIFDNSASDYHGNGYIKIGEKQGSGFYDWPVLTYPMAVEKYGKYKLFMRVKSDSINNLVFSVAINGKTESEHDINIGISWTWIFVDVVIPDNKPFDLSIIPKTQNVYFDSFYLTTGNLPSSFSYTSSYVTLHMKMFEIDAEFTPTFAIQVYDYKTTIKEIVDDNWYNFETNPLPGYLANDFDKNYALALYSSGVSDNLYLIWDYAKNEDPILDPYDALCVLTLDPITRQWQVDCDRKYAIRAYYFRDSLDENACKIIVPASALNLKSVQKFDVSELEPLFVQTKIVNTDSTNKVSLSLPDRQVSIVMDQSGSMSWNDSEGLRHDITRRMVDRLEATYPGEVKYNLISLGSTPIKINFFAVVESDQVNTSDTNDVANSFFADQESGYSGVRIIRKKGSSPTGPLDGEIVTEGFIERAYNESLIENEIYYYAAYTFDSNGVFSDGRFLQVAPRTKLVPRGAGGFTYRVITGTGVKRDQNVIGLWHLNESLGNYIYDFSDSPISLYSLEDVLWLNSNDVPSGVSGIRFNGSTSRLIGSDDSKFIQSKYTFMAWVYPYDFDSKRVILSREAPNQNKMTFKFGTNTNGTLFFSMDDITTASSSASIVDNEWNHVAVTIDKDTNVVKFYINGASAGTGSVTRLGDYSQEPMNIYVGGKSSSFFGKMTEISVHNTIRSDNYISTMSFVPEKLTEKITDNGDRIVALKYVVPEDYNYPGGKISIIKKEAEGAGSFSYKTASSGNETSSENSLVFDGFGERPSSEIDGEIVYNETALVGEHIVSLPFDYIHGRTYYFRIYSQNLIGNYSLSSDSPTLDITIPEFKTIEDKVAAISIPFINQVQNVQIKAGNHKNYISWNSINDKVTEQILVYWSDKGFPIIDNDAVVDSSAILVFSGNPSSSSFVDRNLENEIVNYYAVVAADRYGNISKPTYVSAVPFANADETGIPLLEVKQFRYEIVNENAISLAWEAPVKFQKEIQGWFDQRIALFAQITDELGAPIADVSNIVFSANASVSSAQLAEDVFGETVNRETSTPDVQQCFSLSSSVIGNGFIRGVFKMTSDFDVLSSINSLDADITVSYSIPDRENPGTNVFEFTSLPVHIQMLNPFAMEIINIGDNSANFGTITTSSGTNKKAKRRIDVGSSTDPIAQQSGGGDTVRILCKQTVPLDDQSFISSGGLLFDPNKFKDFDGCWIRRTKPFVARVVVTYRGQAIPVGSSCNVAVFEASDPQCDLDEDNGSNPCSQSIGGTVATNRKFTPGFSDRRSRLVQPPATSMPLRTGLQRLSDDTTKQISYVDVPLRAPNSPQAIMFFGKVSYNGFYSRKKMYVVFDNILRIETTIEVPESNCIDVSEQQARVYLIDPDSPDTDNPKKIPIPDRQIVRWNIRKGRNAKDRPFYSTDNVPAGPGVFSYTKSGTSRKIFFGPACGVTWELYVPCPGNIIYLPEIYAIKASVSYDGLTAFEERPAIIYPPNFGGNSFGSRFLMTMNQYVNDLYADGYDLTKVTIYHDPNITGGEVADCFRQCAANSSRPVFVLDKGQIVEIESGSDFEILYGSDLVSTYDEVLQEYIVTQANEEIGFAQIPLNQTGNSTSFYLRINKFIGRPQVLSSGGDERNTNSCYCIDIPPGFEKKSLSIVSGRTSINFNGETRYLRGGGDLKTGVPPTTIDLKEPLDISIVDIRRNGSSVENVFCDGVSIHEFVVEVSFKQKPVPNGTPVFLTIAGNNPEKIILQSDTVYTSKVNDSILNPRGSLRSFASFFVGAFGPETAFEAQIQAETNYDKRGDVARSMTACVSIKYDPSQPKAGEGQEDPDINKPLGEINNVFSASLDIYDIFTDSWVNKASMNHARGCLTLNWTFDPYGEQLYAIGGLNGKSILSYNERYDIESDTWTVKKPMLTPRFYHMSAQDGNYIYIFGGIVTNGSDLAVSSSVERYNIESDVWESVGSMPIFDQNAYGIALGSCVVIYGKAYIIGGIRKIGSSGSIDAVNDRILIFDFDTLSWSWSEPFTGNDLILYERISPFAFSSADTSSIHVLGGAIPGLRNADTGEEPLEFITDSFKINLTNFTISLDDYLYKQIPSPRYRGIATSIIDRHYFIGGTNDKSQVLNIFELVQENSPTYSYETLARMPTAKTSFGGASDQWRYIYTAGGLTSGRPPGFLQIKANVNPVLIRLDGKQSSTVALELLNDVGERPDKAVRVLVQGILLFPNTKISSATGGDQSQKQSDNSALRDALVYPVVFSSNDFYIENGSGSTVMLPRSDDILRKISEIKKKLGISDSVAGDNAEAVDNTLKIKEGEVRKPYTIKIRITVIDDFYYGQTVVDVNDNEDVKDVTTTVETDAVANTNTNEVIETDTQNNITSFSGFKGCRSISGSQAVEESSNQDQNQNQGRDQENNQPIDQTLKENDNPVFDLNPPQTPQLDSPEVAYFSDIEWIPQIITYVNNGDYLDIVKYIGRLKNDIPFGASPLYDAIIKNAFITLDESLDKYAKIIYVNTDNEENLSVSSIETAIQDVQSIDGFGKVPVVINNFSVVFPVTLSALVSRTDTDSLDKIANETGGQSQTILDAQFVDDILNNSLGRVEGSIGWGLYECVVDLGKNSIVNNIALDYELYSNTDGNWKISTSEDGFNYSDYSDAFNPNTFVEFFNVNARYIKFRVTLLSGLSSFINSEYDLIPTPGLPSLTGININYSVPTESFIYLNAESINHSPQQISVAISANRPKLSEIQVGATTSNSYNWLDYQSGSQPAVDRYGKVFIPIRYNQENDTTLNEPLENIDGFMWKARYGRWDSTSDVVVRDSKNNIINSNEYKAYPQEGFIIFNSKQSDSFVISIENAGRLRLGVRIVNMDSDNPITIDGLGYMYNTNVFLPPPLSQRPPIVSDFRISPSSPTVYQKMSLSYKYFDINQLEEDGEQTQIRWYINGLEIEYLRNLKSWNNIQDTTDPLWIYAFSFNLSDVPAGTSIEQYARQRQESILKVNDTVYATIKVSDGILFSELVRSPSATVVEAPPFISSITIKGKKNNGTVQDRVTTATRAFADFAYFQDGNGSTKSQIIWYVNGIEFKRGDLNAVVGGVSNNEILVGEIKNNIVGIAIGNVLEVTILPASQNIIGNPISSAGISVENDPPSVRNVVLAPNPIAPTSSALSLTYTYVDVESQQQGSTQNDQSSIRWLRAPRGSAEFAEVSSLQNVRIVTATNTSSGEKWKAEVVPFDGVSVGTAVQSNVVDIA